MNFDAGRFRVTRDGAVRFDTDTPAAVLAPSEALTLTDYEIEFPDFYKGIIWTLVNDRNVVLDTYEGSGSSYIGLVGQEWGNGKTYDIADLVLGAAPPGANYLDIQANLTNTVVPAKVNADVPLLKAIPAGKWTRFSGSSCRIEGHASIRRSIDILIEDGQIILRRWQSVQDTVGQKERISQSISTSNGQFTYYVPGSPGTNAGYSTGHYASLGEWLDNATSGSNPTAVFNALSKNTTLKSYRSVWTGSLIITPGRVEL